MPAITAKNQSSSYSLYPFIISTLLITFVLFFIDEGYYDFRWMRDRGNWLVFFIYTTFICLGQLLVAKVFLKNYTGSGKLLISIIAGSIIGFLFLIYVIFTGWQ